MNKKRTNANFDKHEHRVEIFKNPEGKEIRIDHFQIQKNRTHYIQFINTDEILSVTGDYGNWIFCRPFVPSEKGSVSDSYWLEKLRIDSVQKMDKLDFESIKIDIKELIDTGLEEYGYEREELSKAKEWFGELLGETDDEVEYLYKAYRDYSKPGFIDYEMIPLTKEVDRHLLVIFDAFDEICRRLKEKHG